MNHMNTCSCRSEYGWSSVLKTCTAHIVDIFEGICCFAEIFLMGLTSTEQLFMERTLYSRFLCNLCKKISLQCYQLYNFPSISSSHWGWKVFLEISKFTGKHLWQSIFFNQVADSGDCFWPFLRILLKISCLFHFNRKMKWKKREIPWWSSSIYFFAKYRFVWRQRLQNKFGRW